MSLVDVFGSEEHFADHLLPVWEALESRGDFLLGQRLIETTALRWPGGSKPTDPSRPVLVAAYGDVKRMRKAGRTRIAFMEHGAGQSYGTHHGSYAGGQDRHDVGLFLMPNEHSAGRMRATYPKAQVVVVGCPKLDTLPKRQSGPPTIAIGFHWDCYLVPETVSAFAHYRGVLPALAKAYNLIGHGHPRARPLLERRYRRLSIPFVPDFADVCRQADLYICDNSSSMFEFAATGRPVVVLNQPMYRKDVDVGLRFWEAANVGVQVDSPGALLDAVALALTDPPHLRKAREQALDIVYAHRSGAPQRAAAALAEWVA